MIAGKSPVLTRQLMKMSQPKMAPVGLPVILNIIDSNGITITLKVKRTTKFRRIFKAVAEEKGVNLSTLRFQVDGERIQPDDTPDDFDLKNEDVIDCLQEQMGGGGC